MTEAHRRGPRLSFLEIDALRRAADGCTACELYRSATRMVFGAGSPGADLMLVGEQPGQHEDQAGEPFVGPAGKVLDEALAKAGITPEQVYVTNAVKHFRFEARGKMRLHKAPASRHVSACRRWLEEELRLVDPKVVVALGSTAARALIGPGFSVMADHGLVVKATGGRTITATIHPSAVLRAGAQRQAMLELLSDDLRSAATLAGATPIP